MMRLYGFRFAFFALLLGWIASSAAAQNAPATLRGTVRDGRTGEVLIGATVLLPATQLGVATGLDGTFQLRGVGAGAVLVQARNLGYETQTLTLAPATETYHRGPGLPANPSGPAADGSNRSQSGPLTWAAVAAA